MFSYVISIIMIVKYLIAMMSSVLNTSSDQTLELQCKRYDLINIKINEM